MDVGGHCDDRGEGHEEQEQLLTGHVYLLSAVSLLSGMAGVYGVIGEFPRLMLH